MAFFGVILRGCVSIKNAWALFIYNREEFLFDAQNIAIVLLSVISIVVLISIGVSMYRHWCTKQLLLVSRQAKKSCRAERKKDQEAYTEMTDHFQEICVEAKKQGFKVDSLSKKAQSSFTTTVDYAVDYSIHSADNIDVMLQEEISEYSQDNGRVDGVIVIWKIDKSIAIKDKNELLFYLKKAVQNDVIWRDKSSGKCVKRACLFKFSKDDADNERLEMTLTYAPSGLHPGNYDGMFKNVPSSFLEVKADARRSAKKIDTFIRYYLNEKK